MNNNTCFPIFWGDSRDEAGRLCPAGGAPKRDNNRVCLLEAPRIFRSRPEARCERFRAPPTKPHSFFTSSLPGVAPQKRSGEIPDLNYGLFVCLTNFYFYCRFFFTIPFIFYAIPFQNIHNYFGITLPFDINDSSFP